VSRTREILIATAIALAANILWLTLLIFFLGRTDFPNGDKTVYTTNTGECYHLSGCSSLRISKYKTTLKNAVSDGYRQCSNCDPPALKGEDGFHFSSIHYFILVPFSALCAYASAGEILKDFYIDPPPYFVHLAIGVLLSVGFDALI